MMSMQLDQISFDESDKNLFQVDDTRLRADAIRFSILPRLYNVFNEAVAKVAEVYQTDVLQDSMVSYYPHFRTKRDNELKHVYDTAYVGLGGKRSKHGKWKGLKKKDNKTVQIIPIRFGLILDIEGLALFLENWRQRLADDSYKKFFDFNIEYEPLIQRLCHNSYMRPLAAHGDSCRPVSTYKQHYDFIIENKAYDMQFFASYIFPYPITSGHHFYSLNNIVEAFVSFYPVYDSYIQISKGEETRLEKLTDRLNNWLIREYETNESENRTDRHSETLSEDTLLKIREAAEQKVKVMPAIRWQVFQRDHWKCVACGRNAANDVILHVDHIIPRSKGGKDELDNYQTLCHICNIGKSNKDDTNIREFNKT